MRQYFRNWKNRLISPSKPSPSTSSVTISPARIGFGYLIAGFLTLIAGSFLDNLRGPILPLLRQHLDVSYTYAGVFLTVGNVSAIGGTLLLGRLLNHYSERYLLLIGCTLALTPGLLAPYVHGLGGLIILGLLIGGCISILGTLANILAIKGCPDHLRGRILSGQHVMYGVGSFLAPVLVSRSINWQWPWWSSLGIATLVFATLIVVFSRSVPQDTPVAHTAPKPEQRLGLLALLGALVFGSYVGGEVLASMWMATFMVQELGQSPEQASMVVGYFFITLASIRLLSFLIMRPRWERPTIILCLIAGGIAMLFAQQGHVAAFPLIGLLGPFFPLFMVELTRTFADQWKNMTIWVYVSIQTTLGMIHFFVGNITDRIGIERAFLIAPGMILLTLASFILYLVLCQRRTTPATASQACDQPA